MHEGHANEFVWWLDPPSISTGEPYPFGHKVEVAVPVSGDASARVTFFSCVSFGIRFGPVAHTKAETITTHIDPLAPHPPNDVREYRSDGSDIGLKRHSTQAETLRDATTTGSAERAFEAFMKRVTDYRLHEDMLPIHNQLLKTKILTPGERQAVVRRIVGENAQRVLNLIHHVARGLRQQGNAANAANRTIVTYLNAMFPEGKAPSELFQTASGDIQLMAQTAIAQAIDNDIANGVLDLDRLSMLLGGGPGAGIAGEAVMKALIGVLD